MKLKYNAKAHGYWLDGRRCKSPSSIAKVPDDTSALDKWRRRQTGIGLALRPELLTEIAAAGDDKKVLDDICERAMDYAGASSGRVWGSATHRITELLDGGDFVLETPEVQAIRDGWFRLLADNDLEVVLSEGVVVHPDALIAGRFDRIVRHRPSGRLFILDIKTGANVADYLHSHAVQLHCYAAAEWLGEGPGGDTDFEISEWQPMLAVDQSVALVAHLPQSGEASIVAVDIAAGGRCFAEVIQPTWSWRNRKDLRVDAWARVGVDPALVLNLTARLRAVASLSADVAQTVRANWPQGVPSLSAGGHTAEQFASLVALVEMAERATSAPFADPPVPAVARRSPAPSVPVVTHMSSEVDDRPEARDDEVIRVRAAYEALDDAGRSWIRSLMLEASAAGRSFHLASNRSLRAVRIVDGLVQLSAAGADDYDAVRALVSMVMESEAPLMPSIPAGDVVSALSLTEAALFVGAVEMFVEGRLRASVGDDGLVRLAPVENNKNKGRDK